MPTKPESTETPANVSDRQVGAMIIAGVGRLGAKGFIMLVMGIGALIWSGGKIVWNDRSGFDAKLATHDGKIADNARDILAVAGVCHRNAEDIEVVKAKEAADHDTILGMQGDLKAIRAILETKAGHGCGARPTTEPVTRTCTEFLPPVTLCD